MSTPNKNDEKSKLPPIQQQTNTTTAAATTTTTTQSDVMVQIQNFFNSLSPQNQSVNSNQTTSKNTDFRQLNKTTSSSDFSSYTSVSNHNQSGNRSISLTSTPLSNVSPTYSNKIGLNNINQSINSSGSNNSNGSNIKSPQSLFPLHYQYSSKVLQELEEKRKLLVEQLKSVKINLDSQSDEDPISFIKIRMELTKVKNSLETELKTLDDLLNTKTEIEEPNPTPIDGITSLLTTLMSNTTTTTLSSSTTTTTTTAATVNDQQQDLLNNNSNNNNNNIISPIQLNNSLSSNLPPNSIPISQNTKQSNYQPSIIPINTPLDNPDPNQPRFPQRDNISVKLYVDCDDYFAAAAQAIENASREVFITAWFLSPELFLIRFPTLDEKYRLDNLLKRKAMQGVKINIILWDETKIATFKGSKRAKDKLEELHTNIKVIKHPPIIPIYWSHHQKTLIIDQELAFVGGVDFAFGRFDTWCHHLIDVNSTLWKGKDYYNPCIGDMGDILNPFEDSIDRTKVPRMPWHDVMVGVNGFAARDVALNFILRWNHHKDDYYPLLYFDTTPLLPVGTSQCQLLRSMDEWSGGGRIERSIHTYYIQAIEDADHYIYIENQNFCSTHAPNVWNQISFEIVKRIRRAIRKKEVFRVFIGIPCQQDGKFSEETHIRGLMHWQFATLIRDDNSMVNQLKREFPLVDLTEYLCFFSLRTHAYLEGQYVTEQIYIHSKLMIVDDRTIIVGSANINDRSFIGERDSELAFFIRDDIDTITTKMNGKEYTASRLVFNFRLRLWKEHLGLLPQINYPPHDHQGDDINNIIDIHHHGHGHGHSTNSSSGLPPLNPNHINSNSNNSNNNNRKSITVPLGISSSNTPNKKSSHHRSNSFQGLVLQSPSNNRSNLSPHDSPQDSPRLKTSNNNNNQNNQNNNSLSEFNESFSTDILISGGTIHTSDDGNNSVIIEDYQIDNLNNDVINNNNNSDNEIINLNNIAINNNDNSNNNSNSNSMNNSMTNLNSINSTPPTITTPPINIIDNNKKRISISPSTSQSKLLSVTGGGSNSGSYGNELNNIKVVSTDSNNSPRSNPRSISSLHDFTESSFCQQSNIDLMDPVCADFYFGVWIATAASNTRIYDNVFPAIPKNSIKTCEQFAQLQKKPISQADTKLLSEVRGNLVFHPLSFLSDENLQPSFLFTDDLFQ